MFTRCMTVMGYFGVVLTHCRTVMGYFGVVLTHCGTVMVYFGVHVDSLWDFDGVLWGVC